MGSCGIVECNNYGPHEHGTASSLEAVTKHRDALLLQVSELKDKLALVEKMNADNAKMRTTYLDEKTRADRLNGEYRAALQRLADIENCTETAVIRNIAHEAISEKRKCPRTTGTNNDVHCVKDAGHESMWCEDSTGLIRWRD